MTLKAYRPRLPEMKIPMPDRGGRLMPATGATINIDDRFYRTMIDDRDLVPVTQSAPRRSKKGTRA